MLLRHIYHISTKRHFTITITKPLKNWRDSCINLKGKFWTLKYLISTDIFFLWIKKQIFYQLTYLIFCSPPHIWNEILKFYSDSFMNYKHRLTLTHKKKFDWLYQKTHNNIINKIKPINYSCKIEHSENNNNTKYIYSEQIKNPHTLDTVSIKIEQKKFVNNTLNPLNFTNKK